MTVSICAITHYESIYITYYTHMLHILACSIRLAISLHMCVCVCGHIRENREREKESERLEG